MDEPIVVLWTAIWLATDVVIGPALAVAWLGWVGRQLALQARTGQTAGKRCMQLSVVDRASGVPIGLARTVLRWFAHGIDTCVPIAWAGALLGRDVRTLADLVARSTVVDQRKPHRRDGCGLDVVDRAGSTPASDKPRPATDCRDAG